MTDIAVFILTEEHWGPEGTDFSRIGVYASRELAVLTAAATNRVRAETVHDPENYCYLIEEDKLIKERPQQLDQLVEEPGRAWRWWPQLSELFTEVQKSA